MTIEAVAWADSETGARIELSSPLGKPKAYAVRMHGNCLSKTDGWEYEPRPSSRDDEFFQRCRWDCFEDAEEALRAADFSFFR